jgi:hypothetical protein
MHHRDRFNETIFFFLNQGTIFNPSRSCGLKF